jgi:hypothetical protein
VSTGIVTPTDDVTVVDVTAMNEQTRCAQTGTTNDLGRSHMHTRP